MICESCGHAGDLWALGRQSERFGKLAALVAGILHRECDRHCDCQHRLGPPPRQ